MELQVLMGTLRGTFDSFLIGRTFWVLSGRNIMNSCLTIRVYPIF